MHGSGDGGHRTQAGSSCRHRGSRLHDARPGAGHRGGIRPAMSKSKRRVEVVPTPEAEAVDLPEAWKKRPWVPYLIMGILVAVLLGSGLALPPAGHQPGAVALAHPRPSPAT